MSAASSHMSFATELFRNLFTSSISVVDASIVHIGMFKKKPNVFGFSEILSIKLNTSSINWKIFSFL